MDQGAMIMNIFHTKQTLEPAGKLGFGPNERVRLDSSEDMMSVRVLVHVLQDEPDKARALIRAMSPRDRALLSFTLGEVSRVVSEEEDFRQMADRRAVRMSLEDTDD